MFDNLDSDANVDPKSTCNVKCLAAFGLFLKSFLYHVIIFYSLFYLFRPVPKKHIAYAHIHTLRAHADFFHTLCVPNPTSIIVVIALFYFQISKLLKCDLTKRLFQQFRRVYLLKPKSTKWPERQETSLSGFFLRARRHISVDLVCMSTRIVHYLDYNKCHSSSSLACII